MRHGPPTPYLATRTPHLAPTCTCSCARAPRAPPALRPVIPGTRPRKRRRGPFDPEVEKSSGATPSGSRPCEETPFARGAAQPERHRGLRRLSAISAGPQAHQAGKICARNAGGPERARVARGVYFDLRPLYFYPTLARPSSTPAKCLHRLLQDGPQLLQSRTKIFLLQAVGASSISSLRTMTPHGGGGELGVGGSARCGGAYDRTRVRTRVDAGAWQGLRRRFKAPSPSSRRT